jgi:predicted DNA-binding protein
MPSQQTRVNLTLPDELIALLDRMTKVTGAGRATIIREWLIGFTPELAGMTQALELASKKNIDAFKVMGDVLNNASMEAGQLSLDMKNKRRAAMRKKVR